MIKNKNINLLTEVKHNKLIQAIFLWNSEFQRIHHTGNHQLTISTSYTISLKRKIFHPCFYSQTKTIFSVHVLYVPNCRHKAPVIKALPPIKRIWSRKVKWKSKRLHRLFPHFLAYPLRICVCERAASVFRSYVNVSTPRICKSGLENTRKIRGNFVWSVYVLEQVFEIKNIYDVFTIWNNS